MSPKVFELQAALCQAMSYPARLELVHVLRNGAKRVDDLAKATGANLASVSRHLSILRNCGVVTARRAGQEVLYDLANPKVALICDLMREVLVEQLTRQSAIAEGLAEQP
jgi:ArsR family transcriptional regulator